jgi:hypothetical protein
MYSKVGACRLVGFDSFHTHNPDHNHIQVDSNTGYQVGSNIGELQGQLRPRKVQWLSEIGIYFKFKCFSNWNEIVKTVAFIAG